MLAATRGVGSLPSAAADDAAPRASMEKLNAVAEKLKEKKVLVAIGAAAGVVGIALWLRSRRVAAPDEGDAVPVAATAKAAPPPPASGPATDPATEDQRQQALRAKERGNKRFQGRQYDKAIEEYTAAIELSPDKAHKDVAIFYSNRAHCHQQRDAFAEAEADASAALAIDATYVKALCRRGFAREKLATAAGGGRAVELLEAAVLDMTAACILSGFQNDTATGNTDRLLKELGQRKAEARIKTPMTQLPSDFFIGTFVDSFRCHRERVAAAADAVDAADAAVAAAPAAGAARGAALGVRATVHMKARRYAAAMADWAAAVEAYDGEGGGAAGDGAALALEMHGMFLHLLGEYEKAMGRYDRAHALAPRQVSTLLMRSSLWYELEDPKKAHGDMDAALALAPQDADIFCHRGQLCMLLGNNTEAIGDLRKSVRLDGGSVLARIQLGMGLHRSQKQTEAQEVFTDAVTTFPDSPEALNYHGEMLVEMNKIDDARAQFEKAVAVSEGRCARRARLGPVASAAVPLEPSSSLPLLPRPPQVRPRPRQPRRAADAPRRRRRRRAQVVPPRDRRRPAVRDGARPPRPPPPAAQRPRGGDRGVRPRHRPPPRQAGARRLLLDARGGGGAAQAPHRAGGDLRAGDGGEPRADEGGDGADAAVRRARASRAMLLSARGRVHENVPK